MFDKLLAWLREKARLLFGEETSVSTSVSSAMENSIVLWAQMYDTGGPWCHGGKNPLHSLGLPKSIAAELARLTTLEMECLVSGSPRADAVNDLLRSFGGDDIFFDQYRLVYPYQFFRAVESFLAAVIEICFPAAERIYLRKRRAHCTRTGEYDFFIAHV